MDVLSCALTAIRLGNVRLFRESSEGCCEFCIGLRIVFVGSWDPWSPKMVLGVVGFGCVRSPDFCGCGFIFLGC